MHKFDVKRIYLYLLMCTSIKPRTILCSEKYHSYKNNKMYIFTILLELLAVHPLGTTETISYMRQQPPGLLVINVKCGNSLIANRRGKETYICIYTKCIV